VLDWIVKARPGLTLSELLGRTMGEVETMRRVIDQHERELRKE
jgi:hypothetical protein